MSNLKGNLESISLIDVSQLLNVNRKTGMLKILSGKQQGILHFLNGEVIHAEVGAEKGEMAAYQILEWTSGSFDFLAAAVSVPTTIRRSVQDLVMDSARVSDSRKRLQSMFPDLSAVPAPTLQGDALLQGCLQLVVLGGLVIEAVGDIGVDRVFQLLMRIDGAGELDQGRRFLAAEDGGGNGPGAIGCHDHAGRTHDREAGEQGGTADQGISSLQVCVDHRFLSP